MSFERHPINQLNAAGAPDFVTINPQALLDTAKAYFEEATGRVLQPSQAEMYLLRTIAYMLSVRGGEEQLAFENCLLAYARPEWLDHRGIERSMPRLEAAPATTTLRFSSDDPVGTRVRIPAGTRVSDAAGQVQFKTLETVHIEIGAFSVSTKAEALVAGIGANTIPIGSLSALIDPISGISVSNETETGGGAEPEADERYRARLALAYERIGDGLSRERYVTDVLAWNAACVDVAVLRPEPGYVHIFPLMEGGAPNSEELASLLAVFDASTIHQGDFVQAFAPQAHSFSVELALTLVEPGAEEPARAAVEAVLAHWARSLGGYIAPSELIRVAKGQEGVIEADIPGLALELVPDTSWRDGSISSVTVAVV